ncbi:MULTISPECIES: YciI family protein [unclassified Sphingobium]|uniref:YciI family protein n=1 Tax=unclassified Sphingobium TaxID=2611147 RepID=UPI000D159FBB|nr:MULTISPECIES: YciI family protein [unclassified Sphingobium]MBG6120221.1 uncharacterized protein YciI [Sphingobium sp. JAI105]PSO09966.1 hypothetical protein C7E20_19785 [Sphingobium sp. AEW4]TWD00123.1 hypothetical protein FB595_12027 [Sphingobium sp. AEW010]TWD19242.1 hypothetical protein FB596_12038 [Sphingobium sp. AEW013]TWD22093.1 hypothetical protein FB594_12027 [Sphingobium sp. AEW001]
MAHFLVEYSDIGSAEAREKHRGEHIAYRKGLGDTMRLAGPILDDAGIAVGSLVILEADDRAAAGRLAASDPYVSAGVLQVSSVRGYRIAAMKPPQS